MNQNIYSSEFPDHVIDRRLNGALGADVHFDQSNGCGMGRRKTRGLLARVGDVGHDDRRTLSDKFLGDGVTNSPVGAGND